MTSPLHTAEFYRVHGTHRSEISVCKYRKSCIQYAVCTLISLAVDNCHVLEHMDAQNILSIPYGAGYLTHMSFASFLWDISKQHSPRCDTAEPGVPSGAILFAKRNFIEK